MAEMLRIEHIYDRETYKVLKQTAHPNVFDRLRDKVAQGETRLKNCAEQNLRKMIYSAITDKKTNEKSKIELAQKALVEDQV